MITKREKKIVNSCRIFKIPRRAYKRGMFWPIEWSGTNEHEGYMILGSFATENPNQDFVLETPKDSIVQRNQCVELI